MAMARDIKADDGLKGAEILGVFQGIQIGSCKIDPTAAEETPQEAE